MAASPLLSACAFVLALLCAVLMLARVATAPPRPGLWPALGALAEFATWAGGFAAFICLGCAYV